MPSLLTLCTRKRENGEAGQKSPILNWEVHRTVMDARENLGYASVKRSSPEEFDAAHRRLTTDEQKRLKLYATDLVKNARSAAHGRSWEDLLNEAIERLLRRGWRAFEEVSLAQQLCGAMQSIKSAWWRKHARRGEHGVMEIGDARVPTPTKSDDRPLPEIADHSVRNFEEGVTIADLLDDIREHLGDEAFNVAEALAEGLVVAEIAVLLEVTENKVQADKRRIRYWWKTQGKERHHVN